MLWAWTCRGWLFRWILPESFGKVFADECLGLGLELRTAKKRRISRSASFASRRTKPAGSFRFKATHTHLGQQVYKQYLFEASKPRGSWASMPCVEQSNPETMFVSLAFRAPCKRHFGATALTRITKLCHGSAAWAFLVRVVEVARGGTGALQWLLCTYVMYMHMCICIYKHIIDLCLCICL